MTNQKGFSTLTEKTIIDMVKQGDHHAFEELMTRYRTRMFRTAMRILGNETEAEDAVQQAFIACYQNIGKFRGDSAFSTWLTRIAMNESLGMLRKRRVTVELNDLSISDEMPHGLTLASGDDNPEEDSLRRERIHLVRESLSAVKPAYVTTMRLRLVHDMSLEEISSKLSIPVNTVKVHLFRGRKAMREYLEPRLNPAAA